MLVPHGKWGGTFNGKRRDWTHVYTREHGQCGACVLQRENVCNAVGHAGLSGFAAMSKKSMDLDTRDKFPLNRTCKIAFHSQWP